MVYEVLSSELSTLSKYLNRIKSQSAVVVLHAAPGVDEN